MSPGYELVDACYNGDWEKARVMIDKNPKVIWTATDDICITPMFRVLGRGNTELFKYMVKVILALGESHEQVLKQFIEGDGHEFSSPTIVAVCNGNLEALAFIVEHAPSGTVLLEARDIYEGTLAHWAARNNRISTLEYILKNAPNGVSMLQEKDRLGQTPFDIATDDIKKYFTPQKLSEIELKGD